MKLQKKDLERIIYETPNDLLNRRGLDIGGVKRQHIKIGNYGTADIVSYEKHGFIGNIINLYELNSETISISSMLRASKCMLGIKRYMASRYGSDIELERKRLNNNKSIGEFVMMINIIAPKIVSDSDMIHLTSLLNDHSRIHIVLYTYEYNIDGIMFHKMYSDFYKKNDGFVIKKRGGKNEI